MSNGHVKMSPLHSLISVAVILLALPLYVGSEESGWTSWSDWTKCSVTCGYGTILKTAHWEVKGVRLPNKTLTRYETCYLDKECPVNGNWTFWTPWTWCSSACGPGKRERQRYCTNPMPAYGGLECSGKDEESEKCTRDPCPTLPPDFRMALCDQRDSVFMCKTGIQCVNLTDRCNRKVQCTDGSDEMRCYSFSGTGSLFDNVFVILGTVSCLLLVWYTDS